MKILNYLSGDFVEPESGEWLEDLSPATVEIIALNDPPIVLDAIFPENYDQGFYMQDGSEFELSADYMSDVDNELSDLSIEFLPEPEDSNDDGIPDINTLLGGTIDILGNGLYRYNLEDINTEIIDEDYIVYKAKDGESESPIGVITFILNEEGQALRDDEIIAFDQTIDLPEDEITLINLIAFDKAFMTNWGGRG